MPHFCIDELLAIMAMIPFIGYFFAKMHVWWHTHFGHKCHEKDCDSTHVEHDHTVHHDRGPEPEYEEYWDHISEEDATERFGPDVVPLLKMAMNCEFDLFVNYKGDIKAVPK